MLISLNAAQCYKHSPLCQYALIDPTKRKPPTLPAGHGRDALPRVRHGTFTTHFFFCFHLSRLGTFLGRATPDARERIPTN